MENIFKITEKLLLKINKQNNINHNYLYSLLFKFHKKHTNIIESSYKVYLEI